MIVGSLKGLFYFIMIIGFEQSDINSWKNHLVQYERGKKTAFNVGTQNKEDRIRFQPKIQSNKVTVLVKQASADLQSKQKQALQRPQKQLLASQMNNRYKYDKPYDIINLQPLTQSQIKLPGYTTKKNVMPVRNLYNVINGQKMSEELLKERVLMLPVCYNKKPVTKPREFDIVNLQYHSNKEQQQTEKERMSKQIMADKLNKQHGYDKIYNRYYNPEEEETYWSEQKIKEVQRAKRNFEKKLPQSYQIRERYIQDLSVPLPEGVVKFQQKIKNLKKHRQLRYLMEERHKQRNQQIFERQSMIQRNRRLHVDRLSNKSDLVPNRSINITKSQQLD